MNDLIVVQKDETWTRLKAIVLEVAALTFGHLQQRDGRWCIVDLVGKHQRVRTVPMPTWVKVAVDAWTRAADLTGGFIFRTIKRGDRIQGDCLSEKAVWQMLKEYADEAGVSVLLRMTVVAHARNCAAQRVASLNRFKCYWDTRLSRPRSAIWVPSRT